MPSLPSKSDAVSMMRSALAISEPELDTSIGSPIRKILDAVSEVIGEAQVDTYLLNYGYDIDAKSGADLDAFVSNFGFARLPAKRASGTLTFARETPAPQDFFIPYGTQVATGDIVPILVGTTTGAAITQGEVQIDVPCQAIIAGAIGNVQANRLTNPGGQFPSGVTAVTNPNSLTGGADAESDAALRTRFRQTIFRNLAGTEQMFTGVALEDASVIKVNVVGATKRHWEQIELVGGFGISMVLDAQFVYPDGFFFGRDIAGGDIFTPSAHYDFSPDLRPVITSLDSAQVPDGVYELSFQYVSTASRNQPALGITNRVDVWVDGVREVEATETLLFTDEHQFNNAGGDVLNAANFERKDSTNPEIGNYFIRYAFAPITNPAVMTEVSGTEHTNVINFGGVDYEEGIDFFMVNEVTASGMASRSRSGIEWISGSNGAPKAIPDEATPAVVTYRFNEVPRSIEDGLAQWRLVTTDVWVHQAKLWRLDFYLAVILLPGYALTSVENDIANALSRYLLSIDFNGVLQVSDVLGVAHSVGGVDAVRFVTGADVVGSNYGIVRVDSDGDLITNFNDIGRPIDIPFGDDEMPLLNEVHLVQRAQNTFGVM